MRPALRHQKDGSRIAGPLAQLELHQVRVERRHGAVERAAQILHHIVASVGDTGTAIGVSKPGGKIRGKAVDVVNQLGAMGVVERGINLSEIPNMRTVQDRSAQLGRLDRILPAVLDQRAADEHSWCQPIDQAELADRVCHINLGCAFG